MHFAALLTATLPLALATSSVEIRAAPAAACVPVVKSQVNRPCGDRGFVLDNNYLKRFQSATRDYKDCFETCRKDSSCISFSFNCDNNFCRTFGKSLKQKIYIPWPWSGISFWTMQTCFDVAASCPATPQLVSSSKVSSSTASRTSTISTSTSRAATMSSTTAKTSTLSNTTSPRQSTTGSSTQSVAPLVSNTSSSRPATTSSVASSSPSQSISSGPSTSVPSSSSSSSSIVSSSSSDPASNSVSSTGTSSATSSTSSASSSPPAFSSTPSESSSSSSTISSTSSASSSSSIQATTSFTTSTALSSSSSSSAISFTISTSSSLANTSTATTTSSTIVSSVSLSILPSTPPATIYTVTSPQSYSQCVADPSDSTFTFALSDPSDGIPIVNANGVARKATDVLDVIPQFRFVTAPGAPNGVHDLILDESYLAVTLDGNVVFTSASTGGRYVERGSQTLITSLFSYDCDGVMSVGIPGVVPFDFGLIDGALIGQPRISEYNPAIISRIRRQLDDQTRLYIARARYRASLKRIPFTPIPSATYSVPKDDGSAQRCPAIPTGLQAYVKDGARAPLANGCGSGALGKVVPNLDFEQCCNAHDYCFDDCGSGFGQCNSNFGNCNRATCQRNYKDDRFLMWGCNNLADFYEYVVGTKLGRQAYGSATKDRCECGCPSGTAQCGTDKCMDVLSDPKNCGACGNTCASNQCVNGICYQEPEVVTPPANADPCDEANFYWFNSVQLETFTSQGITGTRPPNYVGSNAQTGTHAESKYNCCKACYGAQNCLAYFFQAPPIKGLPGLRNTCIVYTQNYGRAPSLPTPKDQCPNGGTHWDMYNVGQGVAPRSYEPGPCMVNPLG